MRDPEFPARFEREIAQHQLTIVRDDGLYRHLKARRPDTYCMGFDIVTWPGWLAYVGDMGSFTFSRLPDMLEFFRRDPGHLYRIDRRYWAEKCEAADARGRNGVEEFDPERFERWITTERRRLIVEHGRAMDDDERSELWNELGELKRAHTEYGESGAWIAAQEFHFSTSSTRGPRYIGLDTSDAPRCKRYTLRFNWCCCALAWAINQYDQAKATAAAPA